MDKIMMRWFYLALLFLAVPLMGVDTATATGCSCGGAADAVSTGGVATSKSYKLNRSGVGSTFEMATSSAKTYRSNATTGDYLSEGATSSASYQIYHTLSPTVVAAPTTTTTTETTTEGTTDGTTDGTTTTTSIMAKTPTIEPAAPTADEDVESATPEY